MGAAARRIGILAGGGSLPKEIADSLAARGAAVKIVAIEGEVDADFSGYDVARVNWGQIGRLLEEFRAAGVRDLIIIGRVRRPDLSRITPDWGLVWNLPSILRVIAAGGDDSVLRRVVRFFEARGFRVVGPADVAPEIVIGAGAFGGIAPGAAEQSDIALGLEAVRVLGVHDVGQAVVVSGRGIEAVEGAEGTDAMLERVAAQRRARGQAERGRSGVLVKRSKPGQELRVDMPAIGPETITRAVECGLAGIAVEAGRVIAAMRQDLRARADAAGVFIAGVEDGAALGRDCARTAAARAVALNGVGEGGTQASDAIKGVRVLHDLAPLLASRAVVVARGYVLGVEAGEGTQALLARIAGLRQWGAQRTRQRIGVLAVADAREIVSANMLAAARAGLAAVAVGGGKGGGEQSAAIGENLRAAGLGLFAVEGLGGDRQHEATGNGADQNE